MANDRHLKIFRQGKLAWNTWRNENPNIRFDLREVDFSDYDLNELILVGGDLSQAKLTNVDLSDAKLSRANLAKTDLSRATLKEADLSRAYISEAELIEADLTEANLISAILRKANLMAADLSGSDLTEADLSEACLADASLSYAIFFGAKLLRANLVEADLSETYLCEADLSEANLSGADLSEADLRGAGLSDANLQNALLGDADLRESRLIDANLDSATLTGAHLWETQRAGWSIKGVICERCYWDREGKESTEYGPGEFERAFAEKPTIVLEYADGIQPLDLAMLPLVLEQLQKEHPDSSLHVRSIKDEGGKATVTITVDDLADRHTEDFRAELETMRSRLTSFQQRLQHEERLRLEAQAKLDVYRQDLLPIFREGIVAPKYKIDGNVQGQVGDEAKIDEFHGQQMNNQGVNLDDVRKLIEAIQAQRREVEAKATPDDLEALDHSVAEITTEMEKTKPDRTVLKRAADTLAPILDKTGMTFLSELAKQAAAGLF